MTPSAFLRGARIFTVGNFVNRAVRADAPVSAPGDTIPAELTTLRQKSLWIKWSKGGRLLDSEFEEIAAALPKEVLELYRRNLSEGRGDGEIDQTGYVRYAKSLAEYEKPIGVKLRQLKKYSAIGKAAKPPDLPPFDHPEQMAAWWRRMQAANLLKQRIPPRFLQLEMASARTPANSGEEGIDPDKFADQFVDALLESKILLATAITKWKEAQKSGVPARIEVALRNYLKALKAVKETEQAAREDKKASGELIPKAEIFPDVSELLLTLKHIRSTRRRRTLAKLADLNLDPALRERIGAAVDDVREDEDKILRRLKHFGSHEEIDEEFQLNASDQE